MSRRSLVGLLLAACLVAFLIGRNATQPGPARQGPDDLGETTADPPDPDPPMDVVRGGTASASVFASFQIDGMV